MPKRSLIRCAAAVAFTLVLGGRPGLGRAFPPERGMREKDNAGGIAQLVGTPHTTMTRDALAVVLSRELGITTQSPENVRAITAIALANMKVDSNQVRAQLHADGEAFFLAHTRLHQLREMVLAALRAEDYAEARSRLGEALHTLQDFYSHSNWIEVEMARGVANPMAHPKFGAPGEKLALTWNDIASPTEATCQRACDPIDCSDNLRTRKLTSGYYVGEAGEEVDVGSGTSDKCSHGGASDLRAHAAELSVFREGINKDTETQALSPHLQLHRQAVAAATDATIKYVLTIKDAADPARFRAMFATAGSLALALDLSGSMRDVVQTIEGQAATGIAERRKSQDFANKLIFVGFRDPALAPQYAGTSYDDWRANLENASESATSGGKCYELSLEATLQALWSSEPGGIIFLVTDANATTPSLSTQIIEVATKRNVQIHPILIQQDPKDTCDALKPEVYAQIAQGTGGAVHNVSRKEVETLAKQFSALGAPAGHRKLVILDGPNTPGGGAINKAGGSDYSFLLDSSSSRASVIVTASGAVELVRPDGVAVADGAPNVSKTVLDAEVLYELTTPEAGRWSLRAEGGLHGLHVTSDSSLQITALDFVELRGRPGHQGLFPIHGRPVMGKAYDVAVDLSLPVREARLELRSRQDEVLASTPLDARPGADGNALNDGRYTGSVTLPGVPFIAYVVGKTTNDQDFERSYMQETQGQYIALTVPVQQELFPGGTANYEFVLQNQGAQDQFVVRASDPGAFIVSNREQTLTIAEGASARVVVTAKAVPNARIGAVSTITLEVASATNAARSTSGSVALEVSQDLDRDADGLLNDQDNCPTTSNRDQLDYDYDNVGNACDTSPGEPPPEMGCETTTAGDSSSGGWAGGVLLALALAVRELRKKRKTHNAAH